MDEPVAVQPFAAVAVTLKTPDDVSVMTAVVAPVFHKKVMFWPPASAVKLTDETAQVSEADGGETVNVGG